MIIYIAILIPILVTGIFYFIKKHEFVWWEFFIPIGVIFFLVVLSKVIIDNTNVKFTEYWGSTVIAVYEEEPYNYWDFEICSRTYACGTDSEGNTKYCTETYDCSHQDDVGPSWWAKTNIGESINITEKQHDELIKQFKTSKVVINSRKNHAPLDYCVGSRGTKFDGKRVGGISNVYETKWDGSDETRKSYVTRHRYENRIKASDLTIFNIRMVSEEQADSLGLFKYPESDNSGFFSSINGLEYPTILGGNVSKKTQEKFRNLNGKFGPTNQLRLWILIFDNKPMNIAEYQENYWVKGNKNELVVCIGVKNNEIMWSRAFSWAHSGELTAEVQNKVLELYTYKDSIIKTTSLSIIPMNSKNSVLNKKNNKLPVDVIPTTKDSVVRIKSNNPVLTDETWDEYYNYLNNNLHKFQRRSFKEFDYLTVEPSKGSIIFIYVFALIISIIVNLIVIKNETKNQ